MHPVAARIEDTASGEGCATGNSLPSVGVRMAAIEE